MITDVRMPGAGGLSLLERAIELDPARPVILMTGYATIDDAVAVMRMGAVDYIQKPFRNETHRAPARDARCTCASWSRRTRRSEGTSSSAAQGFDERHRRVTGHAMAQMFERVRTVGRADGRNRPGSRERAGPARSASRVAVHELERQERRRPLRGDLVLRVAREPCSRRSCSATRRARSPTPARSGGGRLRAGRTAARLFLDDIDDMPLSRHRPSCCGVIRGPLRSSRIGGEHSASRSTCAIVVGHPGADLRTRSSSEGRFREDLLYRRATWCPIKHAAALRDRTDDIIPLRDAVPRNLRAPRRRQGVQRAARRDEHVGALSLARKRA